MSKITKINNLHIHNSNSSCCWNRYPIKMVYQEAMKAGLKFVGSSNHVYPPLKYPGAEGPEDEFQRHIEWTKGEIDALTTDIPFYLGCELDIIGDSGKHFLLPKYEKMVDYWIAGMHSYFSKDIIQREYTGDDREEFLEDYFEGWGNIAVDYIKRSKPDIFVHIFWQEFQCGLFHEKFMDETAQRIFEAASATGTAIECSSLQIRERHPVPPFWLPKDPRGDHFQYFMKYFTHIFEMAKENGCMVAFGSDAHKPWEIKDVMPIKNLLEKVGFTDDDIFEPTKKE